MPETSSINEQLKKIIELQKIDGEVYNLKVELKEKPEVLEKLKESFEASKGKLLALEEQLKGSQVDRKEKELELNSKEEEIAKCNAQLSQIKTNKEYTAKITEIEHINADKSQYEEQILESYDKSEAISQEIEKEKVNVGEKEKEYLAKKREVEDSVKVIEDRIKVLQAQRSQATEGIAVTYLSRYERILQHKDGIAIVPINGNTCGGCYMNITHQQINEIKMNDQLVECEMCSRILYLEDCL